VLVSAPKDFDMTRSPGSKGEVAASSPIARGAKQE
jgi:hypothetical protein